MDSHAYLVVPPIPPPSAQTAFGRHFQAEAVVDQMLTTLNLSALFQFEGNARAAYSAIAALAYNLLSALRLVAEPASKNWTMRQTMRAVVMTPARLSRSSRRDTLHLALPPDWPTAWRDLLADLRCWRSNPIGGTAGSRGSVETQVKPGISLSS
jgi:hypothetical protein